jgi:hypothetical protein
MTKYDCFVKIEILNSLVLSVLFIDSFLKSDIPYQIYNEVVLTFPIIAIFDIFELIETISL